MALSADRDTPRRDGVMRTVPVAANATLYAGALVALSATGFAKIPGAATDTVIGRATARVVNAGGDGAVSATVGTGCFRFDNATGRDRITRAQIGDACYAVDDATVAKTNGNSARPTAGVVFDVDDLGVWVKI